MSNNIPIGTKCCVKTCPNISSEKSDIQFHRFPTETKARKAWCDALNLSVKSITKLHGICDAHFSDVTLNVSKKLNRWAVPMIDSKEEYIIEGEESASEIYLEIQAVRKLEYACDICKKKFETREERNSHIDNHFKTYKCQTCEQSFIGDRQFEHHRLSNKCVRKKQTKCVKFECYICHKGNFFTKRSLRIHFNRQHIRKQIESQYFCEHCQKTFANAYILKSHIDQIHLQIVKFVCEDCGKSFNRAANLHWHQLIHQNKLPCACKVCGKAFRTLSGLNLHKRTHTGEKPYK